LDYEVFCTSAKSGEGVQELKDSFHGKTSLFWGASGVGKSSLLNTMFPGLLLSTNDISEWSNKGKHTTVSVQTFELDPDSFIIDTPGVREIDPYGIRKEDLSHYFVEFVPYIQQCRFNGCTHNHEPGCAVVQAVEDELISEFRYDSYLRMLNTTEDDLFF
jgi:ribosome biogenesis GTPase